MLFIHLKIVLVCLWVCLFVFHLETADGDLSFHMPEEQGLGYKLHWCPGSQFSEKALWSLVHVHVVLCTGRCWQLLPGDFTCCESWARLLLPPLLVKCSFKIQCIIFQNIIWICNSMCVLLSPVGDVNMLKDGRFCHCDSTTINVWAGTAPLLNTATHSTWRVKPLWREKAPCSFYKSKVVKWVHSSGYPSDSEYVWQVLKFSNRGKNSVLLCSSLVPQRWQQH